MSDCIKVCGLFYIFFVMYVFIFVATAFYNSDMKSFEYSLHGELKERYAKIVNERMNIYFKGLLGGAVIGSMPIFLFKGKKSKFCLSGLLFLFSSSVIYLLHPKSDYIIHHLKSREQREKWFAICKNFHSKKILGLLMGVGLYMAYPYIR